LSHTSSTGEVHRPIHTVLSEKVLSMTSRPSILTILIPLATLLLAGCAVGPNYHPNPNGMVLESYLGGFDALWEIDLWGRIRRQNEAARAGLLATREAQRGIRLTLVSGVAAAYIQLLELDEQLEIAQRSAKSFERTFKLFSDQHENGLASKLELSRASAALHSVTAAIPEIKRQIALKENEINVLLGQNPGPIPRRCPLLQAQLPPEVPAGLPAMLVERRPAS